MFRRRRATQAELDQGEEEMRAAQARLSQESRANGELALDDQPAEGGQQLEVLEERREEDVGTGKGKGGSQRGRVNEPSPPAPLPSGATQEASEVLRTPTATSTRRGGPAASGEKPAEVKTSLILNHLFLMLSR